MQRCKVRDLVDIKKGDYITKNEANEGDYPVILGGKEPAYYIDRYNHVGKAIVISRSGASAGYVSFWDEPIFITDGFIVEPKEEYTHEYIYYVLKSRQTQLHNMQNGSAIPHITPALINMVDVDLHEKKDREKVVSILKSYDEVIENNNKRIKILEQMAENLYKEWFVRFRFPGHEDVEFEGGIPRGWGIVKIGDRFKTVLGGTPSREKTEYWGGSIPWINSGEINKSRIINGSEFITEIGYKKSATELMPAHTTVVAITGATLGQVSFTEVEVCANQSVVGIIDEEHAIEFYLFGAIKQPANKKSSLNSCLCRPVL